MSKTVILNPSEWEDVDERIGAPLRSRLPARVADAHAHLYRRADARLPDTHPVMRGPERCGMAEWRQSLEQHGGCSDISAPWRFSGGAGSRSTKRCAGSYSDCSRTRGRRCNDAPGFVPGNGGV